MMEHADLSVWIGFDPREAAAFAVARESVLKHVSNAVGVNGLVLDDLIEDGLFYRPQERKVLSNGSVQLWDVISDAPCTTEFSISRFLVPTIAGKGLAIFMDCDMLVRRGLQEVFSTIDLRHAVTVVKHQHDPIAAEKMNGQMQTTYKRKNWSSFCVWNVDHPSNRKLTVKMVNELPGRDLHRFCWLEDDEIGELGAEWNWLVGHSSAAINPKVVHHTDGSPCMAGYENTAYADEWRRELRAWAR